VADDEPILLNDHPIDDETEDFPLGLEGRVDERVPNAVTECFQALQQPQFLLTFRVLTADLVAPGSQVATVVLDLSPAVLQFHKRDRCCLIRVDQALDLTVRHPELPLDARPLALTGAINGGITAALLEARPQQGWLGQQLGGPPPNLGLEGRRRDAATVASTAGMARVTGRADIPTLMAAVRGTGHPPATMAADQERAQQVGMPGASSTW